MQNFSCPCLNFLGKSHIHWKFRCVCSNDLDSTIFSFERRYQAIPVQRFPTHVENLSEILKRAVRPCIFFQKRAQKSRQSVLSKHTQTSDKDEIYLENSNIGKKNFACQIELGLFNHFNVPNRKLRKLQYFRTENIECKLIRNVCEKNFVMMRQCVVTFSCLCTVRVAPKSNNIGR